MERIARIPWALYGFCAFSLGLSMYFIGVLLVFPRYILVLDEFLHPVSEWLVWYSGLPLVIGMSIMVGDLLLLLRFKRSTDEVRWQPMESEFITVALTAYNDESSIGDAVADFLQHPRVTRVIVVSNASTDKTMERALASGAEVHDERSQGYGHCVYRCFTEALKSDGRGPVVLCEGDGTFRAEDIDKLFAYAQHADIVNGTRTVERLRQPLTQLTTFMYYGNVFVGKLLEAKHVGRCTITDVGTTYKLCQRDALRRLLPRLNAEINLEFNAHFLDTALQEGLTLVEVPITFHPRVGLSKGGNLSNLRALTVGSRMIIGILVGWRKPAQ